MDDKLQEIIFQICQTLNESNVQYLIIGGSAVDCTDTLECHEDHLMNQQKNLI